MTDTSPEALDRVLALAEKATPGEWEPCSMGIYIFGPSGEMIAGADDDGDLEMRGVGECLPMEANAEYIAAAHPAFVTSLIREVQRLREATTWRPIETCPHRGYVLVREGGSAHEALFMQQELHSADSRGWRDRFRTASGRTVYPDAWMPLPSKEET